MSIMSSRMFSGKHSDRFNVIEDPRAVVEQKVCALKSTVQTMWNSKPTPANKEALQLLENCEHKLREIGLDKSDENVTSPFSMR